MNTEPTRYRASREERSYTMTLTTARPATASPATLACFKFLLNPTPTSMAANTNHQALTASPAAKLASADDSVFKSKYRRISPVMPNNTSAPPNAQRNPRMRGAAAPDGTDLQSPPARAIVTAAVPHSARAQDPKKAGSSLGRPSSAPDKRWSS